MSIALNQIMKDLCERTSTPDTKAMRRLKRGLRVMMKRDRRGILVGIARDDTYPSDHEWNTILNHMPYQVPLVTPRKQHKDGRFYITARIPDDPQPRLL